jgi:hypothetical protein
MSSKYLNDFQCIRSNKFLLNYYYNIILFFSVATFGERGVCFSYLKYHNTFSSLVVIKLFLEMIIFFKNIHSMKCHKFKEIITQGCWSFGNWVNYMWGLNFLWHHLDFFDLTLIPIWGFFYKETFEVSLERK